MHTPKQFFSRFGFLVNLSKLFTYPPPPHPPKMIFLFRFGFFDFRFGFFDSRELKIRVVEFVLKKLLTYFEMLIIPHFTLGTYSDTHMK